MKLRHLILALALTAGPTISYGIGFASNVIVMASNHGQMPVLVPGGCSDEVKEVFASEREREGIQIHSCMTKETRLKILADWIVIRHKGVVSIGDVFEWLGDATLTPSLIIFATLVFKKIFEDER